MRDLVTTKSCPIPDGAIVSEVTTADGVGLRLALFPALAQRSRGTILIVPGRTECIEKYFETVEDFRKRGFAVAVHDPRGQGRSDRQVPGHLGHIGDYVEFVRDLEAVAPIVKARFSGPYILVGHSMGGHIVLRTLMANPGIADRVALCSPFLGFGSGFKLPRWAIGGIALTLNMLGFERKAVPGLEIDPLKLTPFESNELTHDPVRYARWLDVQRSAPDVITSAPTVGWVRASVRSMEVIGEPGALERLSVPLLITAALEDTIALPQSVIDAGKRIPKARLTALPGSRHEALQEVDAIRNQWLDHFDQLVADL